MTARCATFVLLALTIGLGGLACDKASPREPQPQVDSAAVRAGVDSAMRSHFSAFERGDIMTWSGMLADSVFFTAADPTNVFPSRDSVQQKMQQDLGQALKTGVKLTIRPMRDRIWVADDGLTAGATYELDYEVTYREQRFGYRLRTSYLLVRDSSGWKALAAQYSRPVSYDTLFMALVSHQVPGAARVGGQVPSSAGEILPRFRADIRDIGKASIAAAAVIVTPGSVAEGPEKGRRELAQWLGPVGNATEPGDGVRGGLNPSGTVGWVASNLHVPVFAGPESAIAPMRAFFVYRLAGDRWDLVQASLSVGLRERL